MHSKKDKFIHNVIAIVYDFDGTLTPQPMQEYTILPEIGIKKGNQFWKEVERSGKRSIRNRRRRDSYLYASDD